MGKSCQVDTTL